MVLDWLARRMRPPAGVNGLACQFSDQRGPREEWGFFSAGWRRAKPCDATPGDDICAHCRVPDVPQGHYKGPRHANRGVAYSGGSERRIHADNYRRHVCATRDAINSGVNSGRAVNRPRPCGSGAYAPATQDRAGRVRGPALGSSPLPGSFRWRNWPRPAYR